MLIGQHVGHWAGHARGMFMSAMSEMLFNTSSIHQDRIILVLRMISSSQINLHHKTFSHPELFIGKSQSIHQMSLLDIKILSLQVNFSTTTMPTTAATVMVYKAMGNISGAKMNLQVIV